MIIGLVMSMLHNIGTFRIQTPRKIEKVQWINLKPCSEHIHTKNIQKCLSLMSSL